MLLSINIFVFLLNRIREMPEIEETVEAGIIDYDTSSTFCSGLCCYFYRVNPNVCGRGFICTNTDLLPINIILPIRMHEHLNIQSCFEFYWFYNVNVHHLLPRNACLSCRDGLSPKIRLKPKLNSKFVGINIHPYEMSI